jgi:uncharacterized protein
MKKATLTAAALVALSSVRLAAPAAAYDTINCKHDRNAAERTICSSQHLQILDAMVTEAYTDIMNNRYINARIKDAVHDSQVDFIARRDRCGRDSECLAELMQRRASRIKFYR